MVSLIMLFLVKLFLSLYFIALNLFFIKNVFTIFKNTINGL